MSANYSNYNTQLVKCDRHPDEEARLTCGGCGKRICTVCMTLTGEGPRCQDCMVRLNGAFAQPPVQEGEVIAAGEEAARVDSARQAYYATEPEAVYCARHSKTETLLRCGRCSTPICPRCMVQSGVGIRCPDCAANPKRTIGERVEREAASARGSDAPRPDTGFRNYWHNNRAYQKVETQHYAVAILAAFGTALALGVVWGFLMENSLTRLIGRRATSLTEAQLLLTNGAGVSNWTALIDQSIQSSVHLLPEIALGVLVAEAISRVTQGRVGPGLQVIGGLAVLFGVLVSTMTIGARIFQATTGNLPAFDQLLTTSISAIGQQLNGGGIGILIFWALGVVLAVLRLKR